MFEETAIAWLVYAAQGYISGRYADGFLQRKSLGRRSLLRAWTIAYTIGWGGLLLVIDALFPYNYLAQIIPHGLWLLALSSIFFERDWLKQFFVVLSFLAGWDMLRFVASPLAYALHSLWSLVMVWLANQDFVLSAAPIDEVVRWIDFLSRAVNALVIAVCRAVQLALTAGYLRLISRKFLRRDYELDGAESLFLIFPCLTVLFVNSTLRLIVLSVANGGTYLIYDRVPPTTALLPLISLLLLGIIVSSVMLFQKLVERKEEGARRLLLENSLASLKREVGELEDIYADIRGLRHDLRGHLANIVAYARRSATDGDDDILADYARQMENTVKRLDFAYDTGNPITDIIIQQGSQRAKRQDCDFTASFHYPQDLGINVYDLGIILNNALQNALEAAADANGPRSVEVRSYIRGSMFFIEVTNDFDGRLLWPDGANWPSSRKTGVGSRHHGLGLANIERAAQRYNGDMAVDVLSDADRQRFRLTVMLCGKAQF